MFLAFQFKQNLLERFLCSPASSLTKLKSLLCIVKRAFKQSVYGDVWDAGVEEVGHCSDRLILFWRLGRFVFTVCVCVVLRRGSRGEILVRDLYTVRGEGG